MIAYRIKQFVDGITARPLDNGERATVDTILDDRLRPLFYGMNTGDQRHCFKVYNCGMLLWQRAAANSNLSAEDIPYYTIEGKQVPGEIVRRRFLSIDQMMLDSFMIGFNRITKKIYNPKSFLITSLFNIPATVGTDLANMVRNDQYERDGR